MFIRRRVYFFCPLVFWLFFFFFFFLSFFFLFYVLSVFHACGRAPRLVLPDPLILTLNGSMTQEVKSQLRVLQ
ncbi:unnamed protein product [Penicillium nalgiovense]|nr:unnamed protein product [Penicillium nalgiovense]